MSPHLYISGLNFVNLTCQVVGQYYLNLIHKIEVNTKKKMSLLNGFPLEIIFIDYTDLSYSVLIKGTSHYILRKIQASKYKSSLQFFAQLR